MTAAKPQFRESRLDSRLLITEAIIGIARTGTDDTNKSVDTQKSENFHNYWSLILILASVENILSKHDNLAMI
jgi:hypothetical protein